MSEKTRCNWVSTDPLYIKYHDEEWGKPVFDDAVLFESLCLESFQSGLSWITVLKKRENFRLAFDQFDYHKISNYTPKKVDKLLEDSGIIRHQLKIKATINNAKSFIKIQQEFGSFSEYIWAFVNNSPQINSIKKSEYSPSHTPLSDKITKDLKKRGFKFIGTTTIYSFMQAIGMVNDHNIDCFCYSNK